MSVGRKELQHRRDEYERQKHVPAGMQLGVSRETVQVAQNTTVHIRVAEAKGLPAKDLSGTSDPFCILRVDNQEVARTATVWRNLSPFWGEDFTLHIPRGFHNISLYVYDEDLLGQDDIIGKLSLDHKTVTKSVKGVDGWFPLQPIVKDDEVQGDLEVEVKLHKDNGSETLHVQIRQARGLAAKDTSGTSDPFVKFTFRGQTYKTEVVKKTLFPKWFQSFEIPLSSPLSEEDMVDLVVWDWDRVSQNDFLGQSRINLKGLVMNHPRVAWYRLVARKSSPSTKRRSPESNHEDLGSLRVMVLVREDTILPSQYYRPLLNLMVKSVQPPWVNYANVVTMFEEVAVADKTEMATIMVKLYLGQGKVVEYLDFLNQRDLEKSEKATLFRGNSYATKANDQFMKVVATKYLQQVLKPVIDLIYEEKKYCEIDPTKIETSGRQTAESLIETNVATLASYILRASKAVFASVRQCPPVMRLAFKRLRKRVEEKFPLNETGNVNTCYLALSGFIFLRFFAPAILSPKLFFLKDTHPDKKTSRTLTLVAKAIQNMGNLGGQLSSAKELFMKPLHPLILDNVPQVKDFLDSLVDISDNLDDSSVSLYNTSAPIILKEGSLMKKKSSSLALDVVGSMAMQKRYFWLSRFALMYGKSQDASEKDRHALSVSRILAVEPVDPAAFQTPNTFQVVYHLPGAKTEIYYFVAKDVNDQQQWISSLRKVCLQNREMWPIYHPGAMRKGKWTCCQQVNKNATGCSKSHGGVILGDFQDPLDPEAEAQTIYSQLWNGFETLRQKYCADRPFPSPELAIQPESLSIAVPVPEPVLAPIPEPAVEVKSSSASPVIAKPMPPPARHASMVQALRNPIQLPSDQAAAGYSNVSQRRNDSLVQAHDKTASQDAQFFRKDSMQQAMGNPLSMPGSGGTVVTPPWASKEPPTSRHEIMEPKVIGEDVPSKLPDLPENDDRRPSASGTDDISPTEASALTPRRRRRSLKEVLTSPFSGSGGSPRLKRAGSNASQDGGQSPSMTSKNSTPPPPQSENHTQQVKPPVVRLRSLGSLVRSNDPPPTSSPLVDEDAMNGGLQRHQTAPTILPLEAGTDDGKRHPGAVLRPQFSNLSVNSLDSPPFNRSEKNFSNTSMVAQLVSNEPGQDCLPLHQPLRAMSEMLLDELEKLYNAHTVYEAMPRRMSVLESA